MKIIWVLFFIFLIVLGEHGNTWALTEQEVEDNIDFIMGRSAWVDDKVQDASPAEINSILIQLLTKHIKNTERKKIIIDLMSKNLDVTLLDPVIQAYKADKKLEEEVFNILFELATKFSNDKAFFEMEKIAFNITPELYDIPYKRVENYMKDYLSTITPGRCNYLIPHLKEEIFPILMIDQLMEGCSPADIVIPISEVLIIKNDETRIMATETLGTLADKRAIPYLRTARDKEKDYFIKLNMTAQLVKLGEFNELELLVQAVGDKSKDVREGAAVWLKEVTGRDIGEDQALWRKWFKSEKKKRGV
jgi:hypothetical protein